MNEFFWVILNLINIFVFGFLAIYFSFKASFCENKYKELSEKIIDETLKDIGLKEK